MAEVGCRMLPDCIYGSAKKGKVMIAVFPESDVEAAALKKEGEKIESLFQKMGYEPHVWLSELKKVKKEKFFEEIKEAARGLENTEKLAVVIICPQKQGKLQMTHDSFEMENIYNIFKAETCPAMICEPKLFIFHTHPYHVHSSKKRQDTHRCSGKSNNPKPDCNFPVTVPSEGYMFVVYSFEDYMNEDDVSKSESVFLSALTEVLEEDLEKRKGHKEILELMVDVSSKVLQKDKNKMIPEVLSTLNSRFYLKQDIL